MDPEEHRRCCALLGIDAVSSFEELERIYLKRSFALIRKGTKSERDELRTAYETLVANLQAQSLSANADAQATGKNSTGKSASAIASVPVYQMPVKTSAWESNDLISFDSRSVNLVALPMITMLAYVINVSPLGFFLKGFHVWMHEFGHATVAWLVGRRALPLPIGWTNVDPKKSSFVYFGVLFLLIVLLVAGWRERKVWPVLIALAVAPLQYYMTWRMPEYRADLWLSFGGVGGEFYLGALLMALFYVQFPEKFQWGLCRYLCAFLGASSFLNAYFFWRQVKRGVESIPWGSMV